MKTFWLKDSKIDWKTTLLYTRPLRALIRETSPSRKKKGVGVSEGGGLRSTTGTTGDRM